MRVHAHQRQTLPKQAQLTLSLLALFVAPAVAADHDNIDAGRPLDFDDAETIAYREKTIEVGAAVLQRHGDDVAAAASAEFLTGFAHNWQASVGVHPQLDRRFDAGNLEFGVLHNFNRETQASPALALRADIELPTGRGARGLDGRLRAIASRHFGRYGRLHLNADLGFNGAARANERELLPGAILGYSAPLGFPARFNRAFLAQIAYRAAPDRGDGALLGVGIGLRQQVSPRSVFDIGIKSDIAGRGSDRENFRLVAGYSTAF